MESIQFPVYIQQMITSEFLMTFKQQLDNIFASKKPQYATYNNFYQRHDNTKGLRKALYNSCEIHKSMELYNYIQELEWDDADILRGSLTEMLYQRGIIEEGNID